MADMDKDEILKEDEIQEEAGETTQQEEAQEAEADGAQTAEGGEETAEAGEQEDLQDEDPETEEKDASDQDASGSAKTEGQKEGGIKNFFKKNKKDKKDQQIEELTDRVRRQMAEFDNFRKRTQKEKAAMFEVGAKSVIEKILPVVDNFERGLASAADPSDPYVEGMQKIYKQMMTTLESLEVKPIEAVGKEFNPDLHNAVMHVDDDSVGENVVVEELQKGYMYRDSVVRYSMVKVAN